MSKPTKNPPRERNINLRLDDKCFRILQKEAGVNYQPLGTYAAGVLNKYLNFYLKLEKRGDVPMPNVILREVYNSLKEEEIGKIQEITKTFGQDNLKLTGNAMSVEHIVYALERWFGHTSLDYRTIQNDKDQNKIIISSRHNLGMNWSKITSGSIIDVLHDAGAECKPIDISENIFSIEVKKEKFNY